MPAPVRARSAADEKPEPGVVAANEPLAEWERELLEPKGEQSPPPAAVPAEA